MISYEGHIAQSAAEMTPSPHTPTFPSCVQYICPHWSNRGWKPGRTFPWGASCLWVYGQCKLDSEWWRMRTRESQEGVERIRGEAGGGYEQNPRYQIWNTSRIHKRITLKIIGGGDEDACNTGQLFCTRTKVVIHPRQVLTCKHSVGLRFAYRPLESDCCLNSTATWFQFFYFTEERIRSWLCPSQCLLFVDTWHSPGWVQRRKEQGCWESTGFGGRRVCGLAVVLPSGICVIFRVPVSL